MSRLIRVLIQNSLRQNKNREEVKNRDIRYLPDLSIFNLLSVFDLVQKKLKFQLIKSKHVIKYNHLRIALLSRGPRLPTGQTEVHSHALDAVLVFLRERLYQFMTRLGMQSVTRSTIITSRIVGGKPGIIIH